MLLALPTIPRGTAEARPKRIPSPVSPGRKPRLQGHGVTWLGGNPYCVPSDRLEFLRQRKCLLAFKYPTARAVGTIQSSESKGV